MTQRPCWRAWRHSWRTTALRTRARRHDQDHVLDLLDGLRDLAPPVLAALEVGQVLPQAEAVLVVQPPAQLAGQLPAVAARVGHEDARLRRTAAHRGTGTPCAHLQPSPPLILRGHAVGDGPPALLPGRRSGRRHGVMNLGLAQQAIAARNPDRECIVTPTRRLTYAQVAERARRLANVLHGARPRLPPRARAAPEPRVRAGPRRASTCSTARSTSRACWARYLARVAPFNVNYRYVDDELLYLLTDSDAAGVDLPGALRPHAGAHPRPAAEAEAPDPGRRRQRRGAAARARSTTRRRSPRAPDTMPPVDAVAGRPLHPLHRRHDGRAEGRAVAPGGHLPRRHDGRAARDFPARRPSRSWRRTPPRTAASCAS